MTSKPKTIRSYRAPRRQAQAAETRQLIVEAAQKLFVERGYAGTTIQAVAADAGVAVETVYAVFGSKSAILKRWIEVAVGGDERQIPLLQRPQPQAVKQERNPRHQIQLFAQDMRRIMQRVSPAFEVMRVVAKTEPDVDALLKGALARRMQNLGVFVQWLTENGKLRDGLTREEATETVWTLTSAEVYRLLTGDRGWPGDRYESWLTSTLIAVLLE